MGIEFLQWSCYSRINCALLQFAPFFIASSRYVGYCAISHMRVNWLLVISYILPHHLLGGDGTVGERPPSRGLSYLLSPLLHFRSHVLFNSTRSFGITSLCLFWCNGKPRWSLLSRVTPFTVDFCARHSTVLLIITLPQNTTLSRHPLALSKQKSVGW